MPETKDGVSREVLKLHLDVFKHLTSLAALISVALLALGERFEPALVVALVGVTTLTLTLLVCLFGVWMTSHVLRKPKLSNLAFWFSEGLVGIACLLFFSSVLTVLDGALEATTGAGVLGWLRFALGG